MTACCTKCTYQFSVLTFDTIFAAFKLVYEQYCGIFYQNDFVRIAARIRRDCTIVLPGTINDLLWDSLRSRILPTPLALADPKLLD